MPSTLGSLVEAVLDGVYGHSAVQDAATSLTGAIAADDLTFVVDDATNVGTGLIEVDQELMLVKSADLSSNTVTLVPTGRGRRGTTATTHAVGAEVRVAPLMPYSSVIREVNAEINSLYPYISPVATTEMDVSTTTMLYGLPADAVTVLDVRWRDPLGEWHPVRGWGVKFSQNTTDHPTGVTLKVEAPDVGTLRVVYGKPFTNLAALADTLASSGVPESCEDVIRMGVMVRLLPSMGAPLNAVSVSSADASNKPPQPGTGVQLAREIARQYQVRLQQEIQKFRLQYPQPVHVVR